MQKTNTEDLTFGSGGDLTAGNFGRRGLRRE